MRITDAAIQLLLLLATATASYGLDPYQLRDRERRIPQPSPQQTVQQQDSQRYENRLGQDNFSVRSQLPQAKSVSIDQLEAQPEGFQPEALTTYQYQQLQTVPTQQAGAFQTEVPKPEKTVEKKQTEQTAEAVTEAGPQPMEEASGEEQLVTHEAEANPEFSIEENSRIVVLQAETTLNAQTQ